jgi:hypothetical protein
MTKATAQRVRLRRVEHRLAQAELARTHAALRSLTQISSRLAALSSVLTPLDGPVSSASLHAMAEMTARLAQARANLATPVAQATQDHHQAEIMRTRAQRKEESARDHHLRATKAEAAAHDLSADANRAARCRRPGWEAES